MKPIEPTEPTETAEEFEVRRLLEEAGARPELPEEDLDAIRQTARFAWAARQRNRSRARGLRLALTLAAALALIAVGLFLFGKRPIRGPSPALVATVERVVGEVQAQVDPRNRLRIALDDSLFSGTSLTTAADGRASLRLPDGSVVRLDRDTRLALGDGIRLTLSAGSLYADTGPGSPLEIATPGGVVRDVGTRFMVRVDAATEAVSVAVRDGRVELRRGSNVLTAARGEALVVGADGEVARRLIPNGDPAWRWAALVSPPFAVEGRTFGEFLVWFEGETGRTVEFAAPAEAATARGIVLHGSLPDLEPAAALETLATGAGYELVGAGDRLVLRSVRSPNALPR